MPSSSPTLSAKADAFFLGVDENGMGPRLGPMVVTSVLAHVDDAVGAKLVTSRARGSIAARVGDSKKLVAFEDSALGEAWARALARRAGIRVETPDELLRTVLLDDDDALRSPCPSHHVGMCWGSEGEAFGADEELVVACERDLAKLDAKGVHFRRARTAVVCTKRLNEAAARGVSRFALDLHTMERLVLTAARVDAGAEVHALCGKVGGYDFYGPQFGPLAGYLHTAVLESRARSEYHVPTVGRLAFVRDADDTHMIVGLASLVGKWVRDHLMRRIIRFHRAHVPDAPDASGYHDPVTARFIDATGHVRKRLRVADECFERISVSRPGPSSKRGDGMRSKSAEPATTSSKRTKKELPKQREFPT
jgi:ribonuclease HII